ncbi:MULTISPECIES: TetR family transcriptional regulator [unclassified Streptomyces]|uniref:TetR family transcriptional regulator n=1 Tax=unclassified Streptomyces TaxID=2593676 RepID=UPI0005AA050D|nr:TetR family transcriptional regulator [Streptomyces sp. NBRC 110035]
MRADKARNRDAVLAAAGRLLDDAADPDDVSMDAVAAAAGVGKGTVFRGFGDRRGLLRALYDERAARAFGPVGDEPAATDGEPAEIALDLLLRTWRFKEENRVLALALERDGSGSPYRNGSYDRLHAHLAALVARARGTADAADFLAHALLAAVRSDLVEHLHHHPGTDPRTGLRALVRSIFPASDDSAGEPPS